ncbi:MAG: outer membrane beta-barrel domain-containing protein [Deltaproteobacteria bacterium]|jgi:outer membrane beta-barrel protein
MKKTCLLSFTVLFVLSCVNLGFCESPAAGEHVKAIQERIFHRHHEIGLNVGYIPDDDFYYAFPVGLGYTYNFNDHFSWEVVRAQLALNTEKGLKDDLEENFGVTPQAFDEPKYFIHSHLVFKPSYGKDAVWNRSVVNHETYLFLGGGMVNYERDYSYGSSDSENAPSVSFGIGRKYFLNQNLCLNLEVRDTVTFKDDETENNIWFGVSLGFRFNLSPRKMEQDSTIQLLDHYLRDRDNE